MEKRKVTVTIGGKPCSFFSDDSDEYISALENRANAVMKETARFSGSSVCTNAVLSVLFLTDKLLRIEQADKQEKADKPEQAEKPPRTEQKISKKNNTKTTSEDKGQVSVWDLLNDGKESGRWH